MLRSVLYPAPESYSELCQRPSLPSDSLDRLMEEIFQSVGSQGDEALLAYAEKFDGKRPQALRCKEEEIRSKAALISEDLKAAIMQAYENIYVFHASQALKSQKVEVMPGITCWQKSAPIEKVGIYIPGGTAPLFSTILMLAIPARIAGCKEVVLCTPADHPAIYFTAALCGVSCIVPVGGAQAIAAMALGTDSVPKVYKIFGPGNQYVTAAKMYANKMGVAIDMPAGPSEVAVYADESANPSFVAADLLSQAEHGVDSQVFLVCHDPAQVERINAAIQAQLVALPRREFAEKSLANSKAIVVSDRFEAARLLNHYAAEHLILSCYDAEDFSEGIYNAGSIFLGHYTPEAAGDYASGTNHTLPTNGHAVAYSGVNLDSFCKKITLQHINAAGLQALGPSIVTMAEAESLKAHANAIRIRLNHEH